MKSAGLIKVLGLAAVAVTLVAASGCGTGVEGTYGDAGAMQVILKSGGAATFSMMGEKKDCTYTVANKKTVTLDCKLPEGPVTLTLSDDGTTLQAPGGVPLKKQ